MLVLEKFVFYVAVDERGAICYVWRDLVAGTTENSQKRGRGGRSVQLPDWVINKIKRQVIVAMLLPGGK